MIFLGCGTLSLASRSRPGAPLWAVIDFSCRVADVTAAVHILTGWYAIFLLGQLADYRRLRQEGRQPQLMIGPNSPQYAAECDQGLLSAAVTYCLWATSVMTGRPAPDGWNPPHGRTGTSPHSSGGG